MAIAIMCTTFHSTKLFFSFLLSKHTRNTCENTDNSIFKHAITTGFQSNTGKKPKPIVRIVSHNYKQCREYTNIALYKEIKFL